MTLRPPLLCCCGAVIVVISQLRHAKAQLARLAQTVARHEAE
jgi:hypothetical protein